jgi:hypothetical protein
MSADEGVNELGTDVPSGQFMTGLRNPQSRNFGFYAAELTRT